MADPTILDVLNSLAGIAANVSQYELAKSQLQYNANREMALLKLEEEARDRDRNLRFQYDVYTDQSKDIIADMDKALKSLMELNVVIEHSEGLDDLYRSLGGKKYAQEEGAALTGSIRRYASNYKDKQNSLEQVKQAGVDNMINLVKMNYVLGRLREYNQETANFAKDAAEKGNHQVMEAIDYIAEITKMKKQKSEITPNKRNAINRNFSPGGAVYNAIMSSAPTIKDELYQKAKLAEIASSKATTNLRESQKQALGSNTPKIDIDATIRQHLKNFSGMANTSNYSQWYQDALPFINIDEIKSDKESYNNPSMISSLKTSIEDNIKGIIDSGGIDDTKKTKELQDLIKEGNWRTVVSNLLGIDAITGQRSNTDEYGLARDTYDIDLAGWGQDDSKERVHFSKMLNFWDVLDRSLSIIKGDTLPPTIPQNSPDENKDANAIFNMNQHIINNPQN